MAEQKQPPISPQQGRMKSGKEEQHSTFSKWRKRSGKKHRTGTVMMAPKFLKITDSHESQWLARPVNRVLIILIMCICVLLYQMVVEAQAC